MTFSIQDTNLETFQEMTWEFNLTDFFTVIIYIASHYFSVLPYVEDDSERKMTLHSGVDKYRCPVTMALNIFTWCLNFQIWVMVFLARICKKKKYAGSWIIFGFAYPCLH
jgi:hypothetical protein